MSYYIGSDENGQTYISHAGQMFKPGQAKGSNAGANFLAKFRTTGGNWRYIYDPKELARVGAQRAATAVKGAASKVSSAASSAYNRGSQAVKGVASKAASTATNAYNQGRQAVAGAANRVGEGARNAYNQGREAVTGAANRAMETGRNAVNTVTGAAKDAAGYVTGSTRKNAERNAEEATRAAEKTWRIGDDIQAARLSEEAANTRSLGSDIRGAANRVGEGARNAYNQGREAVAGAANRAMETGRNAINTVTGAANRVGEGARNAYNQGREAVAGAANHVGRAASTVANHAGEKLSDIAGYFTGENRARAVDEYINIPTYEAAANAINTRSLASDLDRVRNYFTGSRVPNVEGMRNLSNEYGNQWINSPQTLAGINQVADAMENNYGRTFAGDMRNLGNSIAATITGEKAREKAKTRADAQADYDAAVRYYEANKYNDNGIAAYYAMQEAAAELERLGGNPQ